MLFSWLAIVLLENYFFPVSLRINIVVIVSVVVVVVVVIVVVLIVVVDDFF